MLSVSICCWWCTYTFKILLIANSKHLGGRTSNVLCNSYVIRLCRTHSLRSLGHNYDLSCNNCNFVFVHGSYVIVNIKVEFEVKTLNFMQLLQFNCASLKFFRLCLWNNRLMRTKYIYLTFCILVYCITYLIVVIAVEISI